MADNVFLASTVLMGLFLVGILAYMVRGATWRRHSVATGGWSDTLERTVRSPVAWTVGFLALSLELGIGVIVFVGGAGVSPALRQAAGVLVAGTALLVLGGFLLYGVYRSARFRGLKSAQAAGMGSGLVGFLFLAAVVVKLLVA